MCVRLILTVGNETSDRYSSNSDRSISVISFRGVPGKRTAGNSNTTMQESRVATIHTYDRERERREVGFGRIYGLDFLALRPVFYTNGQQHQPWDDFRRSCGLIVPVVAVVVSPVSRFIR